MKLKNLNELRNKMYYEIIKDEDVADMLKFYTQVYVYDLLEGSNHRVVTVGTMDQLRGVLKEYGFTENVYINKLYTVNKQTKTCI